MGRNSSPIIRHRGSQSAPLASIASDGFHNKVISGFQAVRQARVPVAGLEPCDRRVPADLRAESLATVPPTPRQLGRQTDNQADRQTDRKTDRQAER
ncbi:hypothetical protein PoB_007421900 [Plakobranchus ocellatus]|uniref:Uncharacterized protein n=1 Tax=Plakobranchus ocellatus TaxID=259542 RepID=A0AAV4DUM4_9GAST|nr:hypothetical protein PoB_007421900 [Plakobranchus ocellatus]